MANPVYLWLKDPNGAEIKGSVEVAEREGSIEVLSFDHSVDLPTDDHTGETTGARVHSPVIFTKVLDASSTYLVKAATTGHRLQNAEFKFYETDDTNGHDILRYTITLEEVKVTRAAPKLSDIKDPAAAKRRYMEEVHLRYKKITWKYADGNLMHSDAWNDRRSG